MPTRIMNKTREQVLTNSARLARSYWERLVGLMGKKHLYQGEGLIINPCSSVHTHFMRFSIDVIYVSKEHVIVGIDHALRPWQIGHFYRKVQYVIELSAGTAHETGAQVGDRLILEDLE